jgi:hypothetical protein
VAAVREIESGNSVLWFELDRAIPISSDRAKRKNVNTLMISLHDATGAFDFRYPGRGGPMFMRRASTSAAAYQERVRGTIVQFFDPDGRIKLPKQRRSGW